MHKRQEICGASQKEAEPGLFLGAFGRVKLHFPTGAQPDPKMLVTSIVEIPHFCEPAGHVPAFLRVLNQRIVAEGLNKYLLVVPIFEKYPRIPIIFEIMPLQHLHQ